MLFTVLSITAAVLAGAVVALKVVAPMTKTTKDDKALEYAEKVEAVVEEAKAYVAPKPPTA